MPTLLITRPAEDAVPLAEQLRAMGVDSVVSPLMDVVPVAGPEIDTEGLAGFLVTSANGARALAARTGRRDFTVHAVGSASAEVARNLGFQKVTSAEGDVDALAAHVAALRQPAEGIFLHAAGSVTAGNLAGALGNLGFDVRVAHLYEAKPVATLPAAALEALSIGSIDGVVLYSPRTAQLFDRLAADAELVEALRTLRLFALSNNVSKASVAPWAERHIAVAPDQESLLQAVRSCYGI